MTRSKPVMARTCSTANCSRAVMSFWRFRRSYICCAIMTCRVTSGGGCTQRSNSSSTRPRWACTMQSTRRPSTCIAAIIGAASPSLVSCRQACTSVAASAGNPSAACGKPGEGGTHNCNRLAALPDQPARSPSRSKTSSAPWGWIWPGRWIASSAQLASVTGTSAARAGVDDGWSIRCCSRICAWLPRTPAGRSGQKEWKEIRDERYLRQAMGAGKLTRTKS